MNEVLCCGAPLEYVLTMLMPSKPSDSRGKAVPLLFPRHSWCGCFTLLLTPFLAWAPCCVCDSALGLAGWEALGAPLHPICPTCGRCDSCMVGVRRRSYQHSGLACYTLITGPASAWPFWLSTCADRRSAPDDPVRGVRPPLVPG